MRAGFFVSEEDSDGVCDEVVLVRQGVKGLYALTSPRDDLDKAVVMPVDASKFLPVQVFPHYPYNVVTKSKWASCGPIKSTAGFVVEDTHICASHPLDM